MSKNLGGMLSGIGEGIGKFGDFANKGGLLGKLGVISPVSGASLAGNPMSGIGMLGKLFGGGGGGNDSYRSDDGLVNIPGLSTEDALDGFRSVIDFRHMYGPDTKVPNIRHGGQLYSGKLDSSKLDSNNPGQAMFGMSGPDAAPEKKPSFMNSFKSNLSDQLFMKAMQGFMGHM